MDDVTAIEIKQEGITGDESTKIEEHSTKMAEDSGDSGSKDDITDWDGLFRCLHCGEVFEEEAGYLEHQHQHPHDTPTACPDTGVHLDGLLVAKDDAQQTLCCSLCGRIFSDSRGFYSHMMKHRTQRSKENSVTPEQSLRVTKEHIYKCQDCGKSYSAIGHFLNHQRSHKQASKSVFHLLAHLKKKSFQCHTCGRSYSRASALDAHRRCHEVKLIKSLNKGAEKMMPSSVPVAGVECKDKLDQTNNTRQLFECPCGKTFNAQSGLRTHQRFSHNTKCNPKKQNKDPKRQFHCGECEKTYRSRVALVSHQRWHNNRSHNAGKFSCEACGKVFMTLTFYYKHQRLAHSEEETPAKSFLHQVCQLQKKAFECQDCGLKFSRVSALQSHQLCHIDVFKETETLSMKPTSPLPQHELSFSNKEETEYMVTPQETIPVSVTEREDTNDINETDEDMEYYDTGDFNVEVISVSASDGSVEDEDEALQDLDPDLELLCESDQEGKEEMDGGFCQAEMSTSTFQSKQGIDLKIVQIDFESFENHQVEDMERGDKTSFQMEKVKESNHIQPLANKMYICDICGHETKHQATHYNHVRKHEDRKPYKNVLYQLAGGLEKNSFKCEECGKCFSRLSALHSHQQHHPKTKPHQCPDCKMSYSQSSGLYNHRKICHPKQEPREFVSDTKKEVFNPKKTLLGPKVYHCEQCGKGFWSVGAYAHHKQNQTLCADLKERRIALSTSMHPVSGRPRVQVACPVCGRKFRHRGIMKSHMRTHENGDHKCELCGRSFRVFSSLLRHQVVHSAELLPPPIKSFEHQVEQVKKNTYSCPDCGKLFSRAKALKFHMKSHGYETGYSPSSPKSALELGELQCSTCHAHFSKKSSLQSHQKLCVMREPNQNHASDGTLPVSSKYSTKDKTLKCPTCSSLFKSVLSLQYHCKQCAWQNKRGSDERAGVKDDQNNSVDDDKNEQLDDVVKNKADREKSEEPASSNASDLKYKCKECERSFAVVGALNFHKRIHLKGHKTKAKIKLQSYAVHKKLKHTGQAKGSYFCSECGRGFISNAALGTHRRWHTDKKFAGSLVKDEVTNSVRHKSLDEGPFQCNKCGKGFFYLCVLRRHQLYYPPCQTKGEPQPEANTSLESNSKHSHSEFACPECNKTFVRGSLLAAHYESEHSTSSDPADPQGNQTRALSNKQQPAETPIKSEATSSKLKEKAHQCPHCHQSFMNIRGLRAHKWQAHKRSKRKSKVPLKSTKTIAQSKNVVSKKNAMEVVGGDCQVEILKQSSAKKKKVGGRRRKRGRPNLPPLKSIPCLDCGKRYSSSGALYNHRKTCSVLKEQEIKPIKFAPEEPSAPNRMPEPAIKCLFKCHKCGKAFPTEEQLGAHKDLAKSKPYCCALCCRSYWTETQLQQHLAWHDEVRRRLPTELRYRLSATMNSSPRQLTIPLHDKKTKSSLNQSLMPTPVPRSQNSHKCQHCGKAFLSPIALQNHEAQHNSNDSYRCSLCPRTFSEIRDLIDHHQECMGDNKGQMDAHAAVSNKDMDGLTCLECGISFSREFELHQHYIDHARGAY